MIETSSKTKWRVGLFSLGGVLLLGYITVYVNDHPFWWRPCEMVQVTVEDATGLKAKTPVKTLGLDIGYISDIALITAGVQLRICITAPLDMLPATRAYVRSEGFLGDRFLELKPVKYNGKLMDDQPVKEKIPAGKEDKAEEPAMSPSAHSSVVVKKAIFYSKLISFLFNDARAESKQNNKEIPVAEKSADVQQVMNQVSGLMTEVKSITSSLKEAINPDEIRGAVRQLNKTLESVSKTISPEGSLSSTAQRSLLKLEDAIDQLRDQVTKINQGQGSVGKLLNDPVYADELQKILENLNRFLSRANAMKLTVNLGFQQLPAHLGARGFFQVYIWPKPDRYYLVGLTTDPRGKISQTTTITQVGASSNTVQSTQIERGGFAFTAMLGKVFYQRIDLSMGILHGDGAASLGFNFGPDGQADMLQLKNDLYFRSKVDSGDWTVVPDFRSHLIFQPFSIVYLDAGIEGLRKVNGKMSYVYGAGLRFDDEDIKLLFSFL